jgi:hypothetical protein
MTQKIVIEVSVEQLNGQLSFSIEQKEGDLNLKQVAEVLGYAVQHINKQFPFLSEGDSHE